jgi:HlyD family secretion protein
LMTLNTPELEFAVMAAEQDYNARALAAELQKAEKVKTVSPTTGKIRWVSLPREVYLKALAVADQSKSVWDSAIANLAQGTLLAPFDGTVVSVNVTTGELVQANQVVLTFATLDHLQIQTTDLSERDITEIKIGESVDVYIEALDVTVTGRVIRISPIADTSGGDVVFPITIELDEQPNGLLWGMTAEVEIGTK